jgi:Zn-dependent peptidase ImmA (M78 family)
LESKGTLAHGFKAKAERLATEFRNKLSLHPCAPMCAFKLAICLEIPVYSAIECLTLKDDIERLSHDCEWSALTMNTNSGATIIIHNPFHSPARQQSNLMHEIAHIICEHKHPMRDYEVAVPVGMRSFNLIQEEEARYLGSALQLPRPALLWAKKRNMTTSEIADYFNASQEMVTYRMNSSGVNKQSYFLKRKRAKTV